MSSVVEFSEYARLVPPSPDLVRVTSSVGPAGQAITVWATDDDLHKSPLNSFWRVLSHEHTSPVVVTVQSPDAGDSTVIAELGIAVTTVQPLPGRRILLVAAGCLWTPEKGASHNAVIVDTDGVVVQAGVVGDGVKHVLTTPTGRIWVGYSDEGIFGNRGWGFAGGPTPIGSSGLNRFTQDLVEDWRFKADEKRSIESIDDCYALNADGEDAWACNYSEFDVVQVHDGVIRSWTNSVSGPRALAVAGNRVALFGGYPSDHDRLVIAHLGRTALEDVRSYRATLPNSEQLPPETTVIGRGPDLHTFADDTWYRLTIDQTNPA